MSAATMVEVAEEPLLSTNLISDVLGVIRPLKYAKVEFQFSKRPMNIPSVRLPAALVNGKPITVMSPDKDAIVAFDNRNDAMTSLPIFTYLPSCVVYVNVPLTLHENSGVQVPSS